MLAGSPIDILPESSGTAIGDQCAAKKEATPIIARRPFLISDVSLFAFCSGVSLHKKRGPW